MKNVKVLGPGCANCKRAYNLIDEVAKAKGAEVQLEKVEDIVAIASYGIMATPGVVIDGQVVHMGSVPSRSVVEKWFG